MDAQVSSRQPLNRFVPTALLLMGLSCAVIATPQSPQTRELNGPVTITPELCQEMASRHVIRPSSPVTCERLRLVKFAYLGFDLKLHDDGEIVVLDAVAPYVTTIFETLRQVNFPIAKARLMNNYDGNDDASMNDNNTSAFNDRKITGGTVVSMHAFGLAIDINPIQNPYVKHFKNNVVVNPPAGVNYLNRLIERPWMPPRLGMAEAIIDICANNGFLIWGGYWNDPIDYQHFQVGRQIAERMIHSSSEVAARIFNELVKTYRACREGKSGKEHDDRIACVMAAEPAGGDGAK
jgi:hypothetical protein